MVAYTYSRVAALNFNTTPPGVAKSATGSVYAIADTTFTTPLNMTMVVGGSVVTTISSDAQGFFPDFTVADRTSVVWKQASSSFTTVLTTSDPVPGPQGDPGNDGEEGPQGPRGDLATWVTNTFYPLNMVIANPDGDLVKVTTAHTSGASYDATKFGWVNNNAANLTGLLPEASVPTRLTATELGNTYATPASVTTAVAPKLDSATAATTYAPARRPSGAVASGSIGLWDPARFVYNQKPSNTRKLRALLGGALSGKKSGSILFAGDSTTAGFQGNVIAPDLNSLSSYAPAAILRTLFKAGGYTIKGTGPIVANPRGASWTSSASKLDPRFTFTGTWTNQAANINGLIETASGEVEFTDATVTDATIVEFCSPLLNASFEWFVDGVSQGTVVQGSASGALTRYSATGLTPGVHTIKIVRTAGTFRLAWCEIRKAGGGIQLGNLGVGGSTTLIWDRTEAYFPGPTINNYLPDVCGHDLGINDWGSGASPTVSAATFKTQSLSVLNKQIALGIEPFLITCNPTDAKDYTAYNQVKYELADQLDIWLFDLYDLMESYTVSNARGLYSDQTHPEYAGYAIKGQGLYRALTGAL